MIAFLKRIPKWFRMLRRLDIAADNIENYFMGFDHRLKALESDDVRIARAIERDQVLSEIERPLSSRITALTYRLEALEAKPKRRPVKKAATRGARK